MKKYVINSKFNLANNGQSTIILTPDMEKVYVFQKVENLILESFDIPVSIDFAVTKIKSMFSASTFDYNECISFIDELIEKNILVSYDTD